MNSLLSGILKKTVAQSMAIPRSITTTSAAFMKQIEVNHDEAKQSITVKGNYIKSPNEPLLVKEYVDCKKEGKPFCPECTLGLNIKHTDVLILSQYVRADGCMLPRRVTKLCKTQQRRIGTMVTMAQKAGLMINFTPSWCKKDPTRRYGFKKFNKYFDETTIKCGNYN